MASRLIGDWSKASMGLSRLSNGVELNQACKSTLDKLGNTALKKMKDHIDKQDLNWKPLKASTVSRKNGSNKIYVDTGELKEKLSVRRLKSNKNEMSIIVGASPWKKHNASGLKLTDLMTFMEYGTKRMPARPLIRPVKEEMKPIMQKEFKKEIKKTIRNACR